MDSALARLIAAAQEYYKRRQYAEDWTENADRGMLEPDWELTRQADVELLAAIAALSSSPAAPGWIACSERMPEYDIAVLVISKTSGHYLQVYWNRDSQLREHWINQGNEREIWFTKESFTHWMPRPSPPPSLPGETK